MCVLRAGQFVSNVVVRIDLRHLHSSNWRRGSDCIYLHSKTVTFILSFCIVWACND